MVLKKCALIIVTLILMLQVQATSAIAGPICDFLTTECTLEMFVESVVNGNANELRGIVVPGQFALPVVQQPPGKTGYVSEEPGVITQFQLAARYGIVGLLAHNYLEGAKFHEMGNGDYVILIRGDGTLRWFKVDSKTYYQKLQPRSNWSHYRTLSSNERLTTYQLFGKYYQPNGDEEHITLQTCAYGYGSETWGVVFITAKHVDYHIRK